MKTHLESYRMAALCQALGVSRAGYYAWQKRAPRNACLRSAIGNCHTAHKARVGAPSVHADLAECGFTQCERTIGRHMRAMGLCAKGTKKFKRTADTTRSHAVAEHVLNRQFTCTQPNRVWVGDITYIPTAQGWLYLAVVIDLYSRAVVGWQMSKRIDAQLVCDALQSALLTRGQPSSVLVHTDQGSQYASDAKPVNASKA